MSSKLTLSKGKIDLRELQIMAFESLLFSASSRKQLNRTFCVSRPKTLPTIFWNQKKPPQEGFNFSLFPHNLTQNSHGGSSGGLSVVNYVFADWGQVSNPLDEKCFILDLSSM